MDGKKAPSSAPIDIPKKKNHEGPDSEALCLSKSSEAASVGSKHAHLPAHQRLLKSLSRQSNYGSGSIASSRVNIVADSCSILPSFASTISLDVNSPPLSPPINKRILDIKHLDHCDTAQVSTSYQENLETIDPYDNPAYLDTIRSNDSSSSLLKRTFSLPSDYCYNKHRKRPHAKEIWSDFLPDGNKFDENTVPNGNMPNNVYRPSDQSDWRQTMADLLEKPEYINSLESTSSKRGLLAMAAKSFAQKPKDSLYTCEEIDEASAEDNIRKEKKKYKKNLMMLSLSFMCTFTAYMALRNLQSSLNQSGGLGLFSLCTVYGTLIPSCIFSTTIVLKLRPRNTLLVCFFGYLIYSLCNFYPSYYTLLPGSAIAGFCLANSWTAQATYLANIAAGYSLVSGETLQNTLSRFNGIFYLLFQCSQVIGGVISSIVLMSQPSLDIEEGVTVGNQTMLLQVTQPENQSYHEAIHGFDGSVNPDNVTSLTCGSGYCPGQIIAMEGGGGIHPINFYTLLSILTGFSIAGIVIVMFFLDPLEGTMQRKGNANTTVLRQILAVFTMYGDWRCLCIVPYVLYSFLQMSFMFGEFTKVFVTCATGVHMVGYVMLTVALFCATFSYLSGKLQKYVGRTIIIVFGFSAQMAMLTIMLLWTPTSETVFVMFIIGGVWGMADGAMVTMLISLFGVLFADRKESAFSCLKMTQAMSACTFFIIAPYLCTYVKIYILMGCLVLSLFGYIVLEVGLKKQNQTGQVKGPTVV